MDATNLELRQGVTEHLKLNKTHMLTYIELVNTQHKRIWPCKNPSI